MSELSTAAAEWEGMAHVPKDGTMLRLLVLPDQEEFTAFDDSLTPFETIGFNSLADTGEDRWEFAGWDWQQDCFITGRGEVIGWSHTAPSPDGSAAPPSFEPIICVGRATIDRLVSGQHIETGKVILIPTSDLTNSAIAPKEPTPEMLKRGAAATCSLTEHGARAVYQAMISEAANTPSTAKDADHG